MKSQEGFEPSSEKMETAENEIAPKSSEVEIAEIDNEQLAQYIEAMESHIDQQVAKILPESERRIESSVESTEMPTESLAIVRQEYDLDAQLREIQNEAKHAAEEAKEEIMSITREPHSEVTIETREQIPKTESSPAEKLSRILQQAGVESRVVEIENGGEFSEAIILEKNEAETEKMVRLYRGINHLDVSVLEQIPYAMRTENRTGKPGLLEHVRNEVNTLAQNPTYENLSAYVEKIRLKLSAKEARRVDDDLARIEDGILDGQSTRKELIYDQVKHNGGWADSGITPYISASYDPHEAAGYGNEGLIVMDVPLSQIEDLRADTTEANIKGAVEKKYITAILPRKNIGTIEKQALDQQVDHALQRVYEALPANLYDDEELRAERERKLSEETDLDQERWQKDVEVVRQKRAAKLAKRFPEMKIDLQSPVEQGTDIYTKVQRDIFDFYKARLEKIGRNGRNIEDYEYNEEGFDTPKKFDREKPSDTMLLKLRELVLRLEEREEERNQR